MTRFGIAFVDEIDPKLARGPAQGDSGEFQSPRYTRTHAAVPAQQQADLGPSAQALTCAAVERLRVRA